jgi:hypothetical protein
MINSSIFSRATSFENFEDLKADLSDNERMLNRSVLYHLILSFVTSISEDLALMLVEKSQVVS